MLAHLVKFLIDKGPAAMRAPLLYIYNKVYYPTCDPFYELIQLLSSTYKMSSGNFF